MKENSKKEWRLLALALLLMLGGSLLANAIQTVGGSVDVKDVRWVDSYGTLLSAFLFIPEGVSVENPAPAIVTIGGGDTNREALSNWSLELARRGYVVLGFNKQGEGYSEGFGFDFAKGYGGPEALRYLHSLDIIDHDNIGMVGHSMGQDSIMKAASEYPDGYKALVNVAGAINPGLKNVAFIAGIGDDGPKQNPGAQEKMAEFFGMDFESIEEGKIYGSFEDGTAKALYYVPVPHALEIVHPRVIRYFVDWFQQAVPAPNPIPPSNQIWLWKFAGTAIALVGLILFFLPLGAILLRTPFFKSLVKPIPEFKGLTGKGWWIGAILTVVIPVGSLFYIYTEASKVLPGSDFWPMGRPNGIMGWALFGAVVTIILILVNHFVLKGDRNATAHNYGLTSENGKIEWINIGKSLLLAFCLFGIGYLVMVLLYRWLLVDFRIFEVSFRLLTPERFGVLLKYLIPWMLAYTVLSANLHGLMRPKDGKASFGRELLVNVILLAPFYYLWFPGFFGSMYAGNPAPFSGGFMKDWILSFPPTLAIVAVVSTYFYHKTGRVFVGAFLNAILVVWSLIGGNMLGYVILSAYG